MSDQTNAAGESKAGATPKAGKGDAAQAEKPPMHIDRLKAFRDDPGPQTAALAHELLTRCGPLVLDGEQYRAAAGGKIRVKDLRPDPEPEDVAGPDPDLD